MKWSFFLKQKSDQVSVLMEHMEEIKNAIGSYPKMIRLDNSKENISFRDKSKEKGLPIDFEFTPRESPQYNGIVERSFATLYGRVRSMFNEAGLDLPKRRQWWMEAAATATKLDVIGVDRKDEKHPYEKFYGKRTKYESHLRRFGEIGIVTKKNQGIKDKLSDRGIKCMFAGYAKEHAGDVYRMIDPKTNVVYLTRDVVWTDATYSEVTETTPHIIDIVSGDELFPGSEDEENHTSGDDDDEEIITFDEQNDEQEAGRDDDAPIPETEEGEE